VQVDVKAPTKKANTVFCPKNSFKLRGFKLTSGNVKSGALSPTLIWFAIENNPTPKSEIVGV
jgi:hypothetical protein